MFHIYYSMLTKHVPDLMSMGNAGETGASAAHSAAQLKCTSPHYSAPRGCVVSAFRHFIAHPLQRMLNRKPGKKL
jgi:hypothetical protein